MGSETNPIDVEFDEDWYLRAYPDIAQAVHAGHIRSGLQHYIAHGRAEGRLPRPEFDAAWYGGTYRAATTEIGSRDPDALKQHYDERGRHRGYLPYRQAPRPENAAAMPSRFGGLWVDNANALDLVAGRRTLGWITEEEAVLLERFIGTGYVVLQNALPVELVDRVARIVNGAYHGEYPALSFECASFSDKIKWRPEVLKNLARAIDLHWFSDEVCDAIFSPKILRFLHLIFERPVLASQTLAFYNGSQQQIHQDSAYVPYSLPLQFAASWIALQDVEAGTGELEYFVESHRRLPDFLYGGAYKSIYEARRLGAGGNVLADDLEQHLGSIQREAKQRGLAAERFLARRGDVLIWHAELAHGGSPSASVRTRMSLVTHYCPGEVAPLYFEESSAVVRQHKSGSLFSSGNYFEPVGIAEFTTPRAGSPGSSAATSSPSPAKSRARLPKSGSRKVPRSAS